MGGTGQSADQATDQPITLRHVAMISAKLLKRVFGMEINACAGCGGKLKVIASIEEPEVIAKILAHLEKTARIKPSVGFRSARGHRRHRCD